jgi:hypothetical protein
MTEQTNNTEQPIAYFRRFDAEKQEQIQQLIAWARLMGLNGRDLVSIGGKLDRLNKQEELRRNKELVDKFKKTVSVSKGQQLYSYESISSFTFKTNKMKNSVRIATAGGCFSNEIIIDGKTRHAIKDYETGKGKCAWMDKVLLNIYHGDVKITKS